MQLIIASHNVHKIRELRSMLKFYKNFDILSLLDFPKYQSLPETEGTLEAKAIYKALHAAQTLNQWVIADETALIIPALQNHTQSFHDSDSESRKKLLSAMQHLAEPDRQAYFECWIALASPEGLKKSGKGISEGTIALNQKGGNGFGHDCLFVKYDYGKTFAEIDEETKNRISHRRKALDRVHPYLENLSLQEA
jgi:XTP/dITP diphosphohydrolase